MPGSPTAGECEGGPIHPSGPIQELTRCVARMGNLRASAPEAIDDLLYQGVSLLRQPLAVTGLRKLAFDLSREASVVRPSRTSSRSLIEGKIHLVAHNATVSGSGRGARKRDRAAGRGRSERARKKERVVRVVAVGDHFTRMATIFRSKEPANVEPARPHPPPARSKEECQFAKSPPRGGERHGMEILKRRFRIPGASPTESQAVRARSSVEQRRPALLTVRLSTILKLPPGGG
ncbi:hypothetical protein KM043_008161 [Ampulex compressa]|nr:hypothetical protein KM043_008161 [Ampulex compressa]